MKRGLLIIVVTLFLISWFVFQAGYSPRTIISYGNTSGNTTIITDGVPSPWIYWANLSSMQALFRNTLTSARAVQYQVQLGGNTRTLNFQVQNASEVADEVVSGNTITFPNVLNNTNFTYTVYGQELKEEILLANQYAPTNITVRIQFTGANQFRTSRGSIVFNDSTTGDTLFTLPAPIAHDNSTSQQNVRVYYDVYQAGVNFFINISLNETNFSQFTYPITIDPTTQFACGTLISPDRYTVNQSLSTTGTCFTITSSNVILNCAGANVTGDGGNTDLGVDAANLNNITIENCNINAFGSGISFVGITNSTISNNSIQNSTTDAVSLGPNTGYLNITNNTIFSSRSNGIAFQKLVSNNTVTNNTIYNNSVGIVLTSDDTGPPSNNSIFSNRIHSNNDAGIKINGSVRNNRIYSNTIYNHTRGQAAGIFINNVSFANLIYDNILITNNTYGIYINATNYTNITRNNITTNIHTGIYLNLSRFTNITLNNITSNYVNGVYLANSTNNNITENTITNHTGYGVAFTAASNQNNASFNTIYNNSYNFLIESSDLNNITRHSIRNGTQVGIYINGTSRDNRIYSNTIESHRVNRGAGIFIQDISSVNYIYDNILFLSLYGVYLNSSSNINVSNNNIYSNNNTGIYLSSSNASNITSNTIYNNTNAGINLSSSFNNLLSLNQANFSQYGYSFVGGTGNNLTGNNATNNTISQYFFASSATATFTGVNRALNSTASNNDIEIRSSANVTTRIGANVNNNFNNFTTDFGTIFFDTATNISIKLISLGTSGVLDSGCNGNYLKCTLITQSSNVANISSLEPTAIANLGSYYDLASVPSSKEEDRRLGKYSNGWQMVGQSEINTTTLTVRYDGVTSFSIFGIVEFEPNTTTVATTTTSTDKTSSGESAATTSTTTIIAEEPVEEVEESATVISYTIDEVECASDSCSIGEYEQILESDLPLDILDEMKKKDGEVLAAILLQCEGEIESTRSSLSIGLPEGVECGDIGVTKRHDDGTTEDAEVLSCEIDNNVLKMELQYSQCSYLVVWKGKKKELPPGEVQPELTYTAGEELIEEPQPVKRWLLFVGITTLFVLAVAITVILGIRAKKKHIPSSPFVE